MTSTQAGDVSPETAGSPLERSARPGVGARGHAGPPLWPLAAVSLALFVAGIAVSAALTGSAQPSPFDSGHTIARYLGHSHIQLALALAAFLQFGSAIPLGLYTATINSRLHHLGVRAAGATIALYGGVAASLLLTVSGLSSWVLSRPETRANLSLGRVVADFCYVTGGPGFVVPLGLLLAGAAVPALIIRLLPRWLAWTGLVIAAVSELATLSLVTPSLAPCIAIGRFAGLLWLIAAGALLPRARPRRGARQPVREA